VTASGVLAARRDLPVGIAGEGGRVVQVLVDAGSWVNKGQVLAIVDRSVQAEEIASQAANVEVREANARLAQSKLDRSLKLVSNGFISNADIEQLVATRDAAQAQVRVARATLGQLRASAARLNVVAPEAGLVLTRQVEPGQIVSSASGTLFRIARDGELEMQARLSESNLARLAIGDTAQVTPVGTTQPFTGHIWQLAPTIDATPRRPRAHCASFRQGLRPGGFATSGCVQEHRRRRCSLNRRSCRTPGGGLCLCGRPWRQGCPPRGCDRGCDATGHRRHAGPVRR
jgi:RND family efflux transporter MFP subunit